MRSYVRMFVLSFCTVIILYIYFAYIHHSSTNGLLSVTFLDVGQGDAIFIESPNGTQVLIDGGSGNAVLRALSREMGYFDRDIDLVIATHPDADHIGGLIEVLEHYTVESILTTDNLSESPVANRFLEAVNTEKATHINAHTGEVLELGEGMQGSATLRILFPDRNVARLDSNVSSVIAQLKYGEIEFLFTGDAPQSIEEYLVSLYGKGLASEVLKVGHHGSRTSTSEDFLRMVSPTIAVISAGKDNSYGHPHREVLDLLDAYKVKIKNTALEGSIHMLSDGKYLWLK